MGFTLSAYSIKYKTGKQKSNADTLSRFSLAEGSSSVPILPETLIVTEYLSNTPLIAAKIMQQIKQHDKMLQLLKPKPMLYQQNY